MNEDDTFDKIRYEIHIDPWNNKNYYASREDKTTYLARCDLYNHTTKKYIITEHYVYGDDRNIVIKVITKDYEN